MLIAAHIPHGAYVPQEREGFQKLYGREGRESPQEALVGEGPEEPGDEGHAGLLQARLQRRGGRQDPARVASSFNEYGETLTFPAGGDHQDNDFRVFGRFILAGFVPPYSLFVQALMAAYQLKVAQLHPTSLFLLAVFQFLCEGLSG